MYSRREQIESRLSIYNELIEFAIPLTESEFEPIATFEHEEGLDRLDLK